MEMTEEGMTGTMMKRLTSPRDSNHLYRIPNPPTTTPNISCKTHLQTTQEAILRLSHPGRVATSLSGVKEFALGDEPIEFVH